MTDEEERGRSLTRLPPSYAFALRLHDEGASPERIARLLGIAETAVEPLLRLARAKLAELQRQGGSSRHRSSGEAQGR